MYKPKDKLDDSLREWMSFSHTYYYLIADVRVQNGISSSLLLEEYTKTYLLSSNNFIQ